MTSTDMKIGMAEVARPSSRVLKPPGGGHSNIFAEPEVAVNAPRPKYNQQNSSNLNACMGSTDPNKKVEQLRAEVKEEEPKPLENGAGQRAAAAAAAKDQNDAQNNRGRVPPGGYSSGGFW